ncbi:MAG: hypothetical protein HQK50_08995 [Oligoflexia bacterium]|nr:hypothetical protein [Oligoflexia bacterium]MBF0365695.1 hypothetical protein [Oligoflexia bacterium]
MKNELRKFSLMLILLTLSPAVLAETRWSFQDNGAHKFTLKKYSSINSSYSDKISVQLTVDANAPTITKLFYGADFAVNEVYPGANRMREIKIGFIRIGGSAYDRYDYENSLILEYPFLSEDVPFPTPDIAGRNFSRIRDDVFATQMIRQFAAEPMLQVNITGFMPKIVNGRSAFIAVDPALEAAKFVKKMNGQHKLAVKYFAISNEPLQWASTHRDFIARPLSADEYIDRYVKVVIAMRKAQEEISGNPNDIRILGPEESQSWNWYQTEAEDDCKTSVEGVRRCSYGKGLVKLPDFLSYFLYRLNELEKDQTVNPKQYKLLDYFSIHTYPYFRSNYHDRSSFITDRGGEQDVERYLKSVDIYHNNTMNTVNYAFPLNRSIGLIPWIKDIVARYYPKAEVAITEFAVDSMAYIDYHPAVYPIFTAELLAIAAKEGVALTSKFLLNGEIYNPNSHALVTEGNTVTPTFRSYEILTNHFLGKILTTKANYEKAKGEDLTSYATYNANKKVIAVLVFNRTSENKCATIQLEKRPQEFTSLYSHCFGPWSLTLANVPTKESEQEIEFFEYGSTELNVKKISH